MKAYSVTVDVVLQYDVEVSAESEDDANNLVSKMSFADIMVGGCFKNTLDVNPIDVELAYPNEGEV